MNFIWFWLIFYYFLIDFCWFWLIFLLNFGWWWENLIDYDWFCDFDLIWLISVDFFIEFDEFWLISIDFRVNFDEFWWILFDSDWFFEEIWSILREFDWFLLVFVDFDWFMMNFNEFRLVSIDYWLILIVICLVFKIFFNGKGYGVVTPETYCKTSVVENGEKGLLLLSNEEALARAHGIVESYPHGSVVHKAVQTNLVDVICRGTTNHNQLFQQNKTKQNKTKQNKTKKIKDKR